MKPDGLPPLKPARTRRKMQRVTMNDVAEQADVSPSTVSLYLRRPAEVSPAIGKRIAHAIDDLNYVPSFVAGGLAAASSRAVSIIVPSVRNAFFAETVSALQLDLGKEGLHVLLGHTEYSEREEENLVRAALSWSPAAIVLTGLSHSPATQKLLRASKVPVVEIWELGGQPLDIAVGFHHEQAGAAVAAHLIARGRRKLLFLGARLQEDRRAAQRSAGFLQQARSCDGVGVDIVQHPAPASAEVGAMLLAQLLEQYPDVDAVACSNDLIALGVLFECQRRGVQIPERLALVGFGDMSFSATCNPPLTTVRPSGDLIGSEAARLILERIKHPDTVAPQIVDTRFMLLQRQSS